MSPKNQPEDRPIIRVGTNGTDLVWPNGTRQKVLAPEIELARRELNRVTRLPELDVTASPLQQQNRADTIFEARTQLGHAVRSFVRACEGDPSVQVSR